jgi:carboxyl-terminal processing protease
MSRRTLLIWISPLVLVSVYAGLLLARVRHAEAATGPVYWEADLFESVRGIVGRRYVDSIDSDRSRELFYASIRAYLKGLDRYCDFYSPQQLARLQEDTRGEFSGIGVYIRTQADGLLVTAAREGYPAWQGGIRPGDLIISIEGTPIPDMPPDSVLGRLKGPVGTSVRVGVKPREGKTREVTLTRATIRIESVLGIRLVDDEHGVGYIRVDSFRESTTEDFRRGLGKLRDEGARSIILDLRHNDGGVLPTAVEIADCFLSRGDVVVTRGRREDSVKVYRAKPERTLFPDQPLVVLVNGFSASASEVVAGALQDHRRAVLVGERTYGKFLVQSIIELEDGPDRRAAIRLTTAKYLTPFGRFLQRDEERGVRGGLLPEVVVPLGDEATRALTRRWEAEANPGWHHLDAEPVNGPPDLQLKAAVDLLCGVSVVERLTDGKGR